MRDNSTLTNIIIGYVPSHIFLTNLTSLLESSKYAAGLWCVYIMMLTLRKIAIWQLKNCQKLDIFSKKNWQKFSFFSEKKLPLAIFLKKMKIFGIFFFEKMSNFWQFFDSQMAIFRRVSFALGCSWRIHNTRVVNYKCSVASLLVCWHLILQVGCSNPARFTKSFSIG